MFKVLFPESTLGVWWVLAASRALAAESGEEAAIDNPDTDGFEVIIFGKRESLRSARDIKRDKLETVDSVVADDINKPPDFNVTDALSRVTGVQILRDRGEGAGVAIRGLTQAAANANGWVAVNPYGNFFPGSSSIGGYLVGNPALLDNARILQRALGTSGDIPATNPLGSWHIGEETQSGYLMAILEANGLPLDGNFGARVVHTKEQVDGNQTNPTGGVLPISVGAEYTDYLPSLNLRYRLTDGLHLRGAVSQTLTRPDFNQLSPSLTLNTVRFIGNAGNPALKPIRSDNFDTALEYYFNATGLVSLTGFFKQVDGFIANMADYETHQGSSYLVTRPRNTGAAEITGFEAGYQHFYDFLPGWLNGLGLQANYTYVDSKIAGSDLPLQNLSPHSFNLIGIYEKGQFSARIAYNWRDTLLNGITNVVGVGALPAYARGYGWLGASLGYRINRHLSFAVEGLNLLNTLRGSYYAVETRPQNVWVNDTQIGASITVRY